MNKTVIKIGDKEYKVLVAETEEEKVTGLSKTKELPEDEGMLFVYEEPQEELYYTMQDTEIPLDIIFLDAEGVVISVNSVEALDKEPVYEEDAQYVLEVNIHSGIQEGDEIEEIDSYEEDDSELTEDEKKQISTTSQMLMLDSEGNVQFRLQGGERIVSMIETRRLIKAALKAYHSDDEADYKKVGRLIFKILDGQDNRDPQYVSLPD